MEFETFTLSNGIRVVHREVQRPVAHCGLFIDAGSRDEELSEQGMAHFIEHCLFKGTKKRRAYHVLSRMEDVGGELNAYTTKEETVIHASFLSNYYARAVELLFDVALQSTFPEREIAKEKDVVLDEIYSYRDTPSEAIFDDFEDQLFSGHSLGRNILGTEATVRSMDREGILRFMERHYGADRMVFSSVGAISAGHLRKLLERQLESFDLRKRPHRVEAPNGYAPQKKEAQRHGYQTHVMMGNRAYAAEHPRSRVLMLLSNLLGGPGMNSRLNLNIREKYGFTYYLESYYQPYSDTGIFGIYLATDPGTADRASQLVHRELRRLREKELGVMQLARAKRQLLGQIAMAHENNNALMLAYGKSLLTFDRIDTFENVRRQIEAISAQELCEVANEIFDPEQLSSLIYRAKNPEI